MSESEILSQPIAEYLKIGASIATPLIVAIAGYILNRSIQMRSAFESRKLSLQAHWAEDFAITAKHFNEGITNYIMLFFSYRARLAVDEGLGTNIATSPQPAIVEQHLELQR